MKLDPNRYRSTLDALKPRILESENPQKTISEASVASHVPLLAFVLFAMRVDVLGPNEQLGGWVGGAIGWLHFMDIQKCFLGTTWR